MPAKNKFFKIKVKNRTVHESADYDEACRILESIRKNYPHAFIWEV